MLARGQIQMDQSEWRMKPDSFHHVTAQALMVAQAKASRASEFYSKFLGLV